jgi:hypothetical protein
MTLYRRLRLKRPISAKQIAVVLACLISYAAIAKIDNLEQRADMMERATVGKMP